jgi:signal transduction histidine kinase
MKGAARSPNFIPRLVISSLVAFTIVGVVASVAVLGQVRNEQENRGHVQARFIANSVLGPELRPGDLDEPLSGARLRWIDELVHERLEGVTRVKIWAPDGSIFYSNEPELVNQRFPLQRDLTEAFGGHTVKRVTDLGDSENKYEQRLADRLLETYVPLQVGPPSDPEVEAVVEIYQDYNRIESRVERVFRTLVLTVLVGLGILYVLLFPIVRRITVTLAQKNKALEEQAAKLTMHLRKERELNRLKGEFIDFASHELRTPVTAIVGSLKMLLRPGVQDDSSVRHEFLRTAESQADLLHSLVDRLFTANRLEDGKMMLRTVDFQLGDVIEEVVHSFGPRASRIHAFVPSRLPSLWNDRVAVRQIVSNLVENALKFSSDDTPVEVGVTLFEDSIAIWVKDHGVGMPTERIDEIFERFYQVDSSSTRPQGGLGLGLSLVSDLLRHVEGTIEVESEPDEGSTFTITLPLRHSAVTGDGVTPPNPEPPTLRDAASA